MTKLKLTPGDLTDIYAVMDAYRYGKTEDNYYPEPSVIEDLMTRFQELPNYSEDHEGAHFNEL